MRFHFTAKLSKVFPDHSSKLLVEFGVVEERRERGQDAFGRDRAKSVVDPGTDFFGQRQREMLHDSAEKVQQGRGDGRVRFHRVMHDQDGRLDVHDVVHFRVEQQPIVEER